MENNWFNLQEFLNIKAATLVAGLLGAFITMLRKSNGSLQARITGYIIAIISVLYLVPFLIHLLDWKFGVVLHASGENLLAFVFGMLSQTLTENFVDDPLGSLYRGTAIFKKIKRVIWNGEALETLPVTPKEEEVKK